MMVRRREPKMLGSLSGLIFRSVDMAESDNQIISKCSLIIQNLQECWNQWAIALSRVVLTLISEIPASKMHFSLPNTTKLPTQISIRDTFHESNLKTRVLDLILLLVSAPYTLECQKIQELIDRMPTLKLQNLTKTLSSTSKATISSLAILRWTRPILR